MSAEHFGNNLRRLRKARGLTQADLARLAGCDRGTVARHEAGVMRPTLETVGRYARALGLCELKLLQSVVEASKQAA